MFLCLKSEVIENYGSSKSLFFNAWVGPTPKSQFVNPNIKTAKPNTPVIATPEIPLAWPTGAGFSENHIYVIDTYCRRAVRVDKTYALEAVCEMK